MELFQSAKTLAGEFIPKGASVNTNTGGDGRSLAFAFGDPEPVLRNRIADYLGVFIDTQYNYGSLGTRVAEKSPI